MTNRILTTRRRGQKAYLIQLDKDLFIFTDETGAEITVFDPKKKNYKGKEK